MFSIQDVYYMLCHFMCTLGVICHAQTQIYVKKERDGTLIMEALEHVTDIGKHNGVPRELNSKDYMEIQQLL